MKTKTLCILGIFALCVSTGCKKSDDKNESSIVGTWKTTDAIMSNNVNGKDTIINLITSGLVKPCDLDDLLRINADKTATKLYGPTRCNPNEPSSESAGSWSMVNNDTQLQIIDTDTTVAGILILSNTTLKLRFEDLKDSTDKYYTDITYTRQ